MAMENETFMSFIDDLPIEMFENWDFHGFHAGFIPLKPGFHHETLVSLQTHGTP